MARKANDVTEAELAIMQVLWSTETSTVRELTDTLYTGGGISEQATVQKLLRRLEAKQFVKRNRETWPHQYSPLVLRDDLISRRLQALADELCDGSLAQLLSQLVRSRRLSAAERQSLRELLDEVEGKTRRKKRK